MTTAAATTAAKAAAADKKTITLTFEDKDLDLHKKILEDAENDDRSPSLNLLRFVRANYGKPSSPPASNVSLRDA